MSYSNKKREIIFQILIDDYSTYIESTTMLTNALITELFKKNKDKEFELLIHMIREYFLNNNLFIYIIQSKYFSQILSVFDYQDIQCCVKLIVENVDEYGKSIFYDNEIEYALMEILRFLKLGKPWAIRETLRAILKISIYQYLPKIILCVMDTINSFPSDIKKTYYEIYNWSLEYINVNNITFIKFTHLYNILPTYGIVKIIGYPLEIISEKLCYNIIDHISYLELNKLLKNKYELFQIFKFILNNYKYSINISHIVYKMDKLNFMKSMQKELFDVLVNNMTDRFHNYDYIDTEIYIVRNIRNILWNTLNRSFFLTEYLYIITKILDIVTDKKIYTKIEIWYNILEVGGSFIDQMYGITKQYNPDFVLHKELYGAANHNDVDRLIALGIIKMDSTYDNYFVCQYICESYSDRININTLIKFNQLGFPLSIECYKKLERPQHCPHKEWGSVCNCPPNYKSVEMFDYLNKNVTKDLNWQSVKHFMRFKMALRQFFDNNKKLKANVVGQVFYVNRFAKHISSFYGYSW